MNITKRIAKQIIECFRRGNKVLICGNGGSAAMAQHMAAEFVGHLKTGRRALPAISLTTDTSILTATGNDYSFDIVFSRQVEALGKPGDILIGITTSGKSKNVLRAIEKGKEIGLITLLLPPQGKNTARIQEKHLRLIHDVCQIVENTFIEEIE